ncbi:SMI1/KNR4 family protein [Spartinivicinus poritis]|uniref:SMI1/KNR4 family protein n=1 Tax=Spartinivicinus poritis TaxID=2994640 RepID=A0ABT5UJI2_9GAMM|nr:SMI1/KNR4 family protein [Spartinivicinus sp. A2-2]MDE1465687.1 SMI1/KNR4 family protein [Spartinivicinus sp. A2-2]
MSQIEKILLNLTHVIVKKFPDAETVIKHSLTDEDIEKLSTQINAQFPQEVVDYLKASLPMPCFSALPNDSNETLGTAQFYFSFDDFSSAIADMISLANDNHECGAGEYIQPTFFDAKWLKFAYDDLVRQYLYIDLNPASKGTYGQVFQQDHLCDVRNVLAPSITEFFSVMLDYFENLDIDALTKYYTAYESFYEDDDTDIDEDELDELAEAAEIPFEFIDDTEQYECEETEPLTSEEEAKAIEDEFGLTMQEAEQFASLQEQLTIQNFDLDWQTFTALSQRIIFHKIQASIVTQPIPLVQSEEEAAIIGQPLSMLDFICSQLQKVPKELITDDIEHSIDGMMDACCTFFSPLRDDAPDHQIFEYQVSSAIIQYLSFRAYCGTLQKTQLNTDKIHRKFFDALKKYSTMSPYSNEVTKYLSR